METQTHKLYLFFQNMSVQKHDKQLLPKHILQLNQSSLAASYQVSPERLTEGR